jgi:hypothetical protein
MKEMNFKPYLLGTATETERTAIDRDLLTNDEVFEQVLLAEDDLIEAYLQQQLSPLERRQFEQVFLLDPERQEKLRLAQALRRYANDPAKQKKKAAAATHGWGMLFRPPAWQVALVSVFLLVVAAVGIKTYFSAADSPQLARSSPSPTTTIAPTVGTEVLAVELVPGQTRAINSTPLKLTPNLGTVEFKLALRKNLYSVYEVILHPDGEAEQKWPGQFQPKTSSGLPQLIVQVPVTALDRGGYSLRLDGVTPLGNKEVARYFFTVKR